MKSTYRFVFPLWIYIVAPLVAVGVSFSPAFAEEKPAECAAVLQSDALPSLKDLRVQVENLKTQFPNELRTQAAIHFLTLGEEVPELFEWLPERDVLALLVHPGQFVYHRNLNRFLEIFSREAGAERKDPSSKIATSLRKMLINQVPWGQINFRVRQRAQNQNTVKQVLGELSRPEALRLFYGEDSANPSPKSLLGQYLKESQATSIQRSFKTTENRNGPQGPEKTVVAVSNDHVDLFKKYFARPEFLIPFGHARMIHDGRIVGYSGPGGDLTRFPSSEFTILPALVLKTSEAQRAGRYLDLISKKEFLNWSGPAKAPWKLPGYLDGSGPYSCCTYWNGGIPLMDETFTEMKVGSQRNHNGNVVKPKTLKFLGPHKHPDPLLQEVWTYPSHGSLARLVGLENDRVDGVFANPGWVMVAYSGRMSNEFVPVVFVVKRTINGGLPTDFQEVHEYPR